MTMDEGLVFVVMVMRLRNFDLPVIVPMMLIMNMPVRVHDRFVAVDMPVTFP